MYILLSKTNFYSEDYYFIQLISRGDEIMAEKKTILMISYLDQ